jgi:hypothetical protein
MVCQPRNRSSPYLKNTQHKKECKMGQVVERLPTKHEGIREVRWGRGGDGTCGSIWKQEESLPGEVEARYQETGKSSYSSAHPSSAV